MSLHRLLRRTYELLLWVFPRGHRARYRHEMVDAFERELGAVRERAGVAAALRFALRGCLDAVLAGAGERRRAARVGGGELGIGLGRDLLHAVRSLARARAYALVCLLSLATGLGVTAAVIMLYRVTMEAPFELDEAGLVEVLPTEAKQLGGAWSYPDFMDLQAGVESTELAAWTVQGGALRTEDADAGERIQLGYASVGYFEMLGLEPTLGRFFEGQDGTASGAVPVVVAQGFWKRAMGGDSAVVGRVLTVNRTPHMVVGVAPEWFRLHRTGQGADAWVPLETHPALAADGEARHDRADAWLGILGRLRDGSSPAQAEAAARSVAAGLAEAHPATHGERGVRVLPWHWQGGVAMAGDGWLMGTVFGTLCVFLMLVVCLNLAGMGMVRAASRERELAVRLAIGSSRRRIVQVLMAESLVLAAVGGVLVIGVVRATLRAISWRYGVPLPSSAELDAPLIALCMAAALATSFVFGLLPALRFSRPDLIASIKDDSGTGGRRSGLLHRVVAATQAGLAVPVLVVAVGVTQGAISMGDVDFGVRQEGLVVLTPSDLAPQGYDAAETERLARNLVREVEGIAGVEVAAAADGVPLDGWQRTSGVYAPETGTSANAQVTRIGPGYLEALGVALLRGRPVGAEDVPGAEPVAVVTATLAESLYEGASPVGRRLTLESGEEDEREVTVVGVAADFAGPSVWAPLDHVLLAMAQDPSPGLGLAVRANPASRANEGLVAAIERVSLELDRELPRPEIATFTSLVEGESADFSLWSAFFGLLAVLLLLLSALGIYGVVAFTVASRTREIGVRMSLGSSRAHVLRQVVWDGVRLAVPGLILGGAAGLAVASLVLNDIFVSIGLPLAGAGTLAAAAFASLTAVLLASLLPARRAASVDPLQALRAE